MRALCLIGLLVATLASSACSSYQLGSEPLPFKKLYVEPARNDSFAPQAQTLLTSQLMQTLMRDARVMLVTREEAEAILKITISDYERNISATQSTDTARARSYDLRLSARISLTNAHNGKAYFKNREVTTMVTAYADSGFQPAEYQSMPQLTRRLAERIRTETLSTW